MSEEVSQERPPLPIAHLVSRRSVEEDRAWAQLYAAIHQPSAAEEVVKQLDADAQSKRNHLALYIRAKTTLREQKVSEARNQRVGAFVRTALTFVVMGPLRLVAKAYVATRNVVVAAMPPVQKEPATARARALKNDPEFTSLTDLFGSVAAAPVSAKTSSRASRKAA
jgi:hypothetical protein